jgi:hypothetical protein
MIATEEMLSELIPACSQAKPSPLTYTPFWVPSTMAVGPAAMALTSRLCSPLFTCFQLWPLSVLRKTPVREVPAYSTDPELP